MRSRHHACAPQPSERAHQELSSTVPFQRDKCSQAPQTTPLPCHEARLYWGMNFPPGLFYVWVASCSLPTLPAPSSLPQSASGTCTHTLVSPAQSALSLWDIGGFAAENPSKVFLTQSQVVWPLGSRGPLWPCCCSNPKQGAWVEGKTWSVPHPNPELKKGTQQKEQSWSLGTLIPADDIYPVDSWFRESEIPKSWCCGLSFLEILYLLGRALE